MHVPPHPTMHGLSSSIFSDGTHPSGQSHFRSPQPEMTSPSLQAISLDQSFISSFLTLPRSYLSHVLPRWLDQSLLTCTIHICFAFVASHGRAGAQRVSQVTRQQNYTAAKPGRIYGIPMRSATEYNHAAAFCLGVLGFCGNCHFWTLSCQTKPKKSGSHSTGGGQPRLRSPGQSPSASL